MWVLSKIFQNIHRGINISVSRKAFQKAEPQQQEYHSIRATVFFFGNTNRPEHLSAWIM